jgi:hypothetical protein
MPDNEWDNYLKHYGVPGMKWGVRNPPGRGVRGKSKPKSAKSMSDKELQAAVTRLNLERNYNRLTQSTSSKIAGKVAKTVGTIAGAAVVSVGTKHAVKALNKGIKKAAEKKAGIG